MTITPTDFDVDFGELSEEMIRENGRSLLLRQPTRVESQSGADAGAVVSSPLSSGDVSLLGFHLAGSSTVNIASGDATGLIVEGDLLLIAGETYAVTGGPYAVAYLVALSNPAVTVGDDEVSAGAASLSFVVAGGASGTVFAGDSFVVTGDPTVYSVVDGPYTVNVDGFLSNVAFSPPLDLPTNGGVAVVFTLEPIDPVAVISAVQISPVLATDVAADEPVAVTFSGTFSPIKGVVSSVENRLIQSGVAKAGDLQVLVSRKALTDAGLEIEEGDELHLGADTSARLAVIDRKLSIPSGELDAAYTLIARLR